MRGKQRMAAGMPIDFGPPRTVTLPDDTSTGYRIYNEDNPAQGMSFNTGTAPVSGRTDTVRFFGRAADGLPIGGEKARILFGYQVPVDDLVIAPRRTYRVQGTVEVAGTNSIPVEPIEWGLYLNVFADPTHGFFTRIERFKLREFVRPASGQDLLEAFDETFVMPDDAVAIELAIYKLSIMDNINPGSAQYIYDTSITVEEG